ncbi:MAG: hypothetical protein FWB94_12380 [Chitinispirillia bacterium]|nr:hypothetical protein [Chitinispirillia bacterium]
MAHILYYITSHGYGHAVRSATVCNCLPDGVRLTVCSDIPAQFFDEELTRQHDVRPGGFDVGCLQSDGVTVLIEETLRAYRDIAVRNKSLLDAEARWCVDNGVDCIVSDITPFAFDVADKAGIPSAAISNFTWHDIYLPYVNQYPQYAQMLLEMADQYRKASVALALYPSLPMTIFKHKIPTPILGRKGRNRRDEINTTFGIDKQKRLALIYAGNFGLDDVNWRKLEDIGGWEFVGVYPLPGNPRNYHTVAKSQFRYEDLSASADAIVAKMGYGVFSESLLNGIPLIYLPRDDFAEFPALDAEARRIGIGVCVDADVFARVGWGSVLEGAVVNAKTLPADGGGAAACAAEIVKAAKNHPR